MRRVDQPLRLLPWPGPEGQPCYLSTDGGGFLARMADDAEIVQLTMGAQLLDHAHGMLNDSTVTPHEFRYLTARLCEALRDALRVAESRGGRLEDVVDAGDAGDARDAVDAGDDDAGRHR